jgi:hypothetical protein
MVHVQLLGEDGHKDTLDHSIESTPFFFLILSQFSAARTRSPRLVFFSCMYDVSTFKKKKEKKKAMSIGCQCGRDCLKSSKIQTGCKRPADLQQQPDKA